MILIFLYVYIKNVNKVQVQDTSCKNASHNKLSLDGIFEFESFTSVLVLLPFNLI